MLSSFLLCFLSLNLIISNGGVSFRSDSDGFICLRSSSPINPNSSSWVSATGVVSQPFVLGYGNDTFGMYSTEDQAALSFLLCFFLSLFPLTPCLNQHIAAFPSPKLCITHFSSLHLLFFFLIIFFLSLTCFAASSFHLHLLT